MSDNMSKEEIIAKVYESTISELSVNIALSTDASMIMRCMQIYSDQQTAKYKEALEEIVKRGNIPINSIYEDYDIIIQIAIDALKEGV